MRRDENGNAAEGARPTSDVRRGLAVWLYNFTEGRCTVCGESVRTDGRATDGDRYEMLHLVPAGPKRLGYVAGNIVAGCRDCNRASEAAGVTDLTPYVTRFALSVPTEWPSASALRALGAEAAPVTRRAARAARGLPF